MPRPAPSPESFLPLTPAVFHLLLSLVDGERHGYAIMQSVEASTDGEMKMGRARFTAPSSACWPPV
jgi:hypothetical protein